MLSHHVGVPFSRAHLFLFLSPAELRVLQQAMVTCQRIVARTQYDGFLGYVWPAKSPQDVDYLAPVVMVKKKYGICCLNAITQKNAFPLPHKEETMTTLTRAECFSSLYLASGYWQVWMHPDDRPKIAFTTP